MVEEARQGTAAPPERVGAWKVGRQLGRGGAGAVFAATHEKTGVEGAIKIAHPSSGAVQRHWFLREAALATRLRHPAIVSLWEAGQLDDGRPFLVYERVVGPTLEEVAESLSLEQVVRFGAQLLDALGYAHDAGVVHCDVTPSNVLLAEGERARLIDFGLAKAAGERALDRRAASRVSGTPGYLSPEQARGAGSPGPASDLFGCGAVLFRLLTGHAPYGGDTALEIVKHTLTQAPLPLRPRRGLQAPKRLGEVVQRLLARDPEHRYPSAALARHEWFDAAATDTPIEGAVRPIVPLRPGLQSLETILVDSVQSARPVAAFSTVQATPHSGIRRAGASEADAAPLFGRDALLDELWATLEAEGEVGVVAGAGRGKSRVLDALGERAKDAGHRVVRTRGRRGALCAPFEALATLCLDAISAATLAPPWLAAERLSASLGDLALSDREGARDAVVGGLLGVGPTGSTRGATMLAHEVLVGLLDLERRPILLMLDDADGVDDGTWEVVRSVRQAFPDRVSLAWAGEGVDGAPLPPLDAVALDALWETLSQGPRPEQDAPADLLALAGGGFDALLAALSPSARSLLAAASVFEGEAPKRALATVAEVLSAPYEVDADALQELLDARLVVEVPDASARFERWVRLPSPGLRAHLEAWLDAPTRRLAHGAAAQWLSRSSLDATAANLARVAHHARLAGMEASAAYAWSEAGRMEIEAKRSAEAARCFERALELAQGPAAEAIDRPRILCQLAEAALSEGRAADADRHAERGLLAVEPERTVLRARLLQIRAEAAVQATQLHDALGDLRVAIQILGEQGDPMELARAHASLGWVLGYRLGRNDEGIAHGRRALEIAAEISAPAFRASLCGRLGANYLRAGNWDGQLDANREDLHLSRRARDAYGQVRAHINLGVCYTNRGDLDRARMHTEAALSLADRCGAQGAAQIAHNNLAMISVDEQRWDEVDAHVAAVFEAAERTGYKRALPETLVSQARACIHRGALDEAADALAKARALSDVADDEVVERVSLLLDLARAQADEADVDLPRSEALIARAVHDPYERAASRLTHAALLRHAGRARDAASEEAEAAKTLRALGADLSLEHRRWGDHAQLGVVETVSR